MCSIQIYFLFPKHSMSFITLCSYTLCLESWFLPTPSYSYPFSTWWAPIYPSRPRTTITSSFLPSQTPLKQIYLSLHKTLFITALSGSWHCLTIIVVCVCVCVCVCVFARVHMLNRSVLSDYATPWTVACKALCPRNFPGKNTGVGCHLFLPPGTLLDPGSNPHFLHLLHWRADSLPLSHPRSPIVMFAYVLISPSSQWALPEQWLIYVSPGPSDYHYAGTR